MDRLTGGCVMNPILDAGWTDRKHLIGEAGNGLDDVAAGRVKDACGAIQSIKRRRSA